MQIVNHPRAVSGLIGRHTRVYILHPVLHGIVEQRCDLARRGGHCLGLADARREPSVEGAQCGVGSPQGCGSKPQVRRGSPNGRCDRDDILKLRLAAMISVYRAALRIPANADSDSIDCGQRFRSIADSIPVIADSSSRRRL
jgi:hypothetical protein